MQLNGSKFSLIINTVIKISVVSGLLVAVSTKQQYSYYIFLRWLVTSTFIYFGYKSTEKKQFGLLIYFGAVAIMFNPFQKFWFQKETWHLIDYTVAGITILTLIYDWGVFFKEH
jgi:hypothetical protein